MKTTCSLPTRFLRFFNRKVAYLLFWLLVLLPPLLLILSCIWLFSTLGIQGLLKWGMGTLIAVVGFAGEILWYILMGIWWDEAFPKNVISFPDRVEHR